MKTEINLIYREQEPGKHNQMNKVDVHFCWKRHTLYKECTLGPQGRHFSKNGKKKKMILEFNFRRGLCYAEVPKSETFI